MNDHVCVLTMNTNTSGREGPCVVLTENENTNICERPCVSRVGFWVRIFLDLSPDVPCTVHDCDFLTKPHYDLVANKNEMAKSLHIDIMDMDRDVEYIMLEIFTMELTSTS